MKICAFSKFSFCPPLRFFIFVPKSLLIFSLSSGNSHVDIVFLGTPYFSVSATFDGFIPDSTSVIVLKFSVRINLFLFTVGILSYHKLVSYHKSNKRSCIKCFKFEFRITVSEFYIRKIPNIIGK